MRGYGISPDYSGADLVVVNTCGFIDAAIDESLEAIGEALQQNGRVIVTGCLGVHPERILREAPQGAGRHRPACHRAGAGRREHAPAAAARSLRRPGAGAGVRLTPRHYAYLKISEGCNNRCSFCIIPSLRGDLASRPIDDVLREAERLVASGVKELLVISQDTSAYGSDLRYRAVDWHGRQIETRFIDLARELGQLGVWVRLHYVYPYPHVDAVLPLMAEGKVLPYLDIPFQHGSPTVLKRMRRPAHAENTLERIDAWRATVPRPHAAQHLHRRLPRRDRCGVRGAAAVARCRAARPRRLLQVFAGGGRHRERHRRRRPGRSDGGAPRALHGARRGHQQRAARTPRRRGMPRAGRPDRGRRGRSRAPRAMRRTSTAWCACAARRGCAPANSPRCASPRRTTTTWKRSSPRRPEPPAAAYSTVTLLARLRGWSTSVPRWMATW